MASCGGDRAMGQVVETLRLCGQIGQRGCLGDEGAPGGLDRDGTGSRQSVVGMTNSVEVNLEGNRDLSHGGHSLTWFEQTGADCPQYLIAYLDIDRHA